MVHEWHITIWYLGIILWAKEIGFPLDVAKMAWNVIYKGGALDVARMRWKSIDDMFTMCKYSHSQNMRIYGGGKDGFIIFEREIS